MGIRSGDLPPHVQRAIADQTTGATPQAREPDRRRKAGAETALVRAILKYLDAAGVFAWRQNTGAMQAPSGRFIRFGIVGMADIMAILPGGRLLAIECKAPGGKQTQNQVAFERRVRDAGGVYVLAYSVDDVIGLLGANAGPHSDDQGTTDPDARLPGESVADATLRLNRGRLERQRMAEHDGSR